MDAWTQREERPTVRRARELVGARLWITVDGERRGGRIVETEAYCADDPASHSYRGETRRNGAMFLPEGHIYVYRSYGIHWCLNVVTAAAGVGEAVLIRAIEPLWGLPGMYRRRGIHPPVGAVVVPRLTNGPGKLCQALGIDGSWDRRRIGDGIYLEPAAGAPSVEAGPRVGISVATDLPWRFRLVGSRFTGRR